VLNRDQSTSIFNPEKWNDDSLVVDPWKRTVYTKQEFLLVNSPANFYGKPIYQKSKSNFSK
jgi:hypothetical protein